MDNLHLGTLGWSYGFWKGKFYPAKTSSKDFLTYYSSRFDTVEVDNTFYRIPNSKTVTNWKNQTPANFTFSLKFPSLITHIKMLKNCERETNLFLERASLLNEKMGPLLLQFPPNFGVEHLSDLSDFLRKLPQKSRYVVEVREKNWLQADFYSLLKANNTGLAWVDSPNMPQISEVTSDFLYVRWEGDRKKINGMLGKIEADTTSSLHIWADKLKPFLTRQNQIFGYFSKYYSGYPPSDIESLLSIIASVS